MKDENVNELTKLNKEISELKEIVANLVKTKLRRKDSSSESSTASQNTGKSSSSRSSLNGIWCENCGDNRHNIYSCWWVTCEFCSKRGHVQDICIKYKEFLQIKLLEGQIDELNMKKQETYRHEKSENNNSKINKGQVEKATETQQEEGKSKEVIIKEVNQEEDSDLVALGKDLDEGWENINKELKEA
jgi:hypothetical protein